MGYELWSWFGWYVPINYNERMWYKERDWKEKLVQNVWKKSGQETS